MADTLQDFLISVKYQVDAASQQNFLSQMGRTAAQMIGIKTEIVGLTTAMFELTRRVAEMGDQWYWMSQRMGSSVLDIKSAAFAMSNLGVSTQQALSGMEGFARWEVTHGAMSLGFMRMFGVTARDTAGQMAQLGAYFRQHGGTYENMWGTDQQRNQFAYMTQVAASMHIDMQTMLALSSGEMEQLADVSERLYKSIGLNSRAMQQFALDAHRVTVEFKTLGLEAHVLWDAFAARLMPEVLPALHRLNEIIEQHMPELTAIVRAFADVIGFLINGFVNLIDVLSKIGDSFAWLAAHFNVSIAGFHGMGLAILALDAVLLRTSLGRFLMMMELLLELLADYQNYEHGFKSHFDWGKVDAFSQWVDDLTGVKGLLWDIVGVLGIIMLMVGPGRLIGAVGGMLGLGARTVGAAAGLGGVGASGVAGAVMGAVAAPVVAGAGIAAGMHEANSPENVETSKKLYGKDDAGSLTKSLIVRLHAWVNGQTEEQAATEIGGGFAPGGAATTPASVGEVSALPGDTSWGDYGTRANNPGNMDYAAAAPHGSPSGRFRYTDPQTHAGHFLATFATMAEGVATEVRYLAARQQRFGMTLAGALHGYAEHGYAGKLGMDPNAPFDITKADPALVAKLLEAQFRIEGRHGSHSVTHEQVMQGIRMARQGSGYPSVATGPTNTDHSITQTNNITITGAADPHRTGQQVAMNMDRANQSLIRSTRDFVR